MEIREAVAGRRSIRTFRPDEVPESLVREILDGARWSPSWGNTQPWEVYVVSGEALKAFKVANCGKLDEGAPPAPDVGMPDGWTEPLQRRYRAVGRRTLEALGIAREDAAGRTGQMRAMFRLFDAPCLIVACIDKSASSVEYAMLDVGLFVQTFCLLAHGRGLGTCILACAVCFPSLWRDLLPEAENKRMVVGVALGYPDREAPVNRFDRERAPLEETVRWVR